MEIKILTVENKQDEKASNPERMFRMRGQIQDRKVD